MEFITVGDDRQRWRVAREGTGRAIVLLHGFPDGPESWADTATAVAAAGWQAVVPYLRGYHPDTITPGRGYSRAEIGQDVIGLLDALDIDRAVVAGHDWGASCLWSALAQAPDRVDGVVPIAIPHPAALRPSPKLAWAVRHFWYFKAPRSDRRTARNDLAYIDTLYRRWSPDWTGADRDRTVARAKQLLADPRVLHEALQWYRDLSLRPDPAGGFRVACPGLLVAGDADFGGDLGPYRASKTRFDAPVELLAVEGAGHWPHREGAAEFEDRLVSFLASL